MYLRFIALFSIAYIATCLAVPPAGAQDLFTVSGVHVDASGASSAEAANIALVQGRPKARQILYRRLTRQQDWTRQPQLDEAALQRISRGYTIANERRSTTRYVADVTYMFNPDAVGRTLRDANIAYTQSIAKRILVIPMAPAYVHGGPWMDALASPRLHDSVVPFTLPSGDADQRVLTALHFDTASWSDVEAAAVRSHAGEAALVQAVYANGRFTVNIRRLGPNEPVASTSVDVPLAQPNVPFAQDIASNYAAAADSAMQVVADLWKARAVVNFSLKGKLPVDVRAGSIAQWGAIQTALANVDNVTSVNVLAMDIGEEQVSISYLGSTDQLKDAMSAQGLVLANRAGAWTLSMSALAGAGQ